MATNCIAPTNVTVSQAYQKPEGSVVLYWNGAQSGTDNPITGYLIRIRDNLGTWSDYCTVYADLSAYSTTVTVSASRGSVRYYSVVTLGEAGLDSEQSTSIASVTVNSLPQPPEVSPSRTEVPYNGNKTVTFSLTPGADTDTDQEVFYYYTTASSSGTKILISGSSVTLTVSVDTTYFFWNYDGYEFNTTPTQITVLVNRLPVVVVNSLTPVYSVTGPSSKIMFKNISDMDYTGTSEFGHSLTYSFKIRYSATISGDQLVSPSELTLAYPTVKTIGIQGFYFQIRVTATDNTWPSDSGFGDTAIYYAPKAPSSTNIAPRVRAYNAVKSLVMSTDYYRKLVNVAYTGGNFSGRTSGFGNISSASLSATSIPTVNLTVTTNIGTSSINYDMGDNGPATIEVKINLTDEFGQLNTISGNIITRITASTSLSLTLTIPNGYTKIYAYDDRNTNPNKTMTFSFPDYSQVSEAYAFAGWSPTLGTNYKDYGVFINNSRYILHNYVSTPSLLPTVSVVSGTVSITYNQSTLGTAATLQAFNHDGLSGALSLTIFDSYGVENTISIQLINSISYVCAPTRTTTSSSALTVGLSGTQPSLPAGTRMVYPAQQITFTYAQKIFTDLNKTNGAIEFNKTVLNIYESNGTTLITSLSDLGADCEIGTSFVYQFGNVTAVTTRIIKICAEDSTGLRSLEYTIGTFAVMPISGPTIGQLISTAYHYNESTTIQSTFICTYNGFQYSSVPGHSDIKAKIKLLNTSITGTQTPLNIYGSGSTEITIPTALNPFTLTSDAEDTNVTLIIEITYWSGRVIEYSFNTLRLRKTIPTISTRKGRMAISKVVEDIETAGISDSVFYINIPALSPYKKVYLVNEADGRQIKVDISTGAADGLVIDCGEY